MLTAKVADCLEGRGVGDANGDSGEEGMFLGRERICWWCGEPLPTFSRSDRQYCSDACRQAAHAATESVSQISRALEAQGGSVGGNGAAAFEPTDAWQDVPDGANTPTRSDLRRAGFRGAQIHAPRRAAVRKSARPIGGPGRGQPSGSIPRSSYATAASAPPRRSAHNENNRPNNSELSEQFDFLGRFGR